MTAFIGNISVIILKKCKVVRRGPDVGSSYKNLMSFFVWKLISTNYGSITGPRPPSLFKGKTLIKKDFNQKTKKNIGIFFHFPIVEINSRPKNTPTKNSSNQIKEISAIFYVPHAYQKRNHLKSLWFLRRVGG